MPNRVGLIRDLHSIGIRKRKHENFLCTVKSEIKDAPQKVVTPKEKALLCLFSFGITTFWGASFISDFTVVYSAHEVGL